MTPGLALAPPKRKSAVAHFFSSSRLQKTGIFSSFARAISFFFRKSRENFIRRANCDEI